MLRLILTKSGRNHPQGPGIQIRSYGTCGPHGDPKERAPKGQNHANFKVTSSSDPEVETVKYSNTFLCEELKFMVVPRVAPMGPRGGGGEWGGGLKSNCFI